jgi:hypothetical protein
LALGKLATGCPLANLVLTPEARVTLIDAALAGAVLAGFGLNALLGGQTRLPGSSSFVTG